MNPWFSFKDLGQLHHASWHMYLSHSWNRATSIFRYSQTITRGYSNLLERQPPIVFSPVAVLINEKFWMTLLKGRIDLCFFDGWFPFRLVSKATTSNARALWKHHLFADIRMFFNCDIEIHTHARVLCSPVRLKPFPMLCTISHKSFPWYSSVPQLTSDHKFDSIHHASLFQA